jgi:cytoskeleton protein RodZ
LDPKYLQELKEARLNKNISLQDISGATRINVRFLEAIEQGDFEILPKPYVRSFIKQYARYIGFDEINIIEQFEESKKDPVPQEHHDARPVEKIELKRDTIPPPKLKSMFLSLAVIGGIALFVYILLPMFSTNEEQIAERPFLDVVREIEEQSEPTVIESIDRPFYTDIELRDSMYLELTTLDTVWLTITVDNIAQQEYILPPGRVSTWRAANEFLITVGNAGGVSISLDNDSIGVLGAPGQVLRNLRITRDGIQ